jgi:hypothetical protein
MKLNLKEKLENYKWIKIQCCNQKNLLDLVDLIESENLNLHYWMPGSMQVNLEQYFNRVRQSILGNNHIDAYVPENSSSVLTLRKNTHSVDMTISTTPEKVKFRTKEPVLYLDYTILLREKLLDELGIV